jgi:hypothetical protein
MSWIKLLYPPPQFDFHWGPWWLRRIHTLALHVAYYLTHTLALVGLALIYFVAVVPMKITAGLKKQDLLEEKFPGNEKSYLKKSEDLSTMDFKRMY